MPRTRGGEVLDQPSGGRRRDHGVAAVDGSDRGKEIDRRSVLEQEAGGSRLQRLIGVLVDVERRQHDDPRRSATDVIARVAATPSSRGIRTSISTTSAVARRNAPIAATPSPASPTTVMSDCDSDQHRETGADQLLVIDQEHVDGHAGSGVGWYETPVSSTRGSVARTSKPPPAAGRATSEPP